MVVTTKELRLNMATVLNNAAKGQNVTVTFGRGKSQKSFEISYKNQQNQEQESQKSKVLTKIENTKLSKKSNTAQSLSQSEILKNIKSIYDL
jgi:hypothetical protein